MGNFEMDIRDIEYIREVARLGTVEELKLLFRQPRINWNQSLMIIAAQKGYLEVVRLLLENEDVQVNQENEYGCTPLMLAAYNGHHEVVKLLLEKDYIQVNKATKSGDTSLMFGAEKGHHEVVRLLLGRDDVQVGQGNKKGNTPLILAAYKGHFEVVKVLLEKEGIQVNQGNKAGSTPLILATQRKHHQVVALLEDKVRRPLYEDQTCLACMDRTPDVVLVPCGHQNMCAPCAYKWTEKDANGCPSDRIPILKILPLEEE